MKVVEYKYRKSMDPYIKLSVPIVYGDCPTFLAVPLAKSKEDLKGADAAIIGGSRLGYGASPWRSDLGLMFSNRAHLGPHYAPIIDSERLRKASLKYGGYLPELDIDVFEHIKLVDYGDVTSISPIITPEDSVRATERTMKKVGDVLDADCIPITIVSNPYLTVKAVADRTKDKVGVIALDAHGDNAPGAWVEAVSEIANVDMTKYVQIGMRGPRNYKEQLGWYKDKNSRVFTYWEIKKMGMEALAEEAVRIASDGTDNTILIIDFDVLDLGAAEGLDEPLGISVAELCILALRVGKNDISAFAIESIPSPVAPIYHIVTLSTLYLMAGLAIGRSGTTI